MKCLREWSQSVERILILGCGLHEPFTVGRSDGCVVQNSTIVWYSFLSLVLVANRLELLIFSWLVPGWIVVLNFHDYVEIDLVILNTKDSCDGSGLNTSESSKGSHP